MNFFAANQPLFSAFSDADVFGKCIFFALFALSILCWVILVQKSLEVKSAKRHSITFQKKFEQNKDQLFNLSIEKQQHLFANIFSATRQKTLEILNKNHFFAENKELVYLTRSDLELVESHVLTTISAEAKKLEKNLYILSTIYTLAPFLGLLGTVWGILVTFGELQSGGSAASNTAMLGGLSTALSTTVLGLVIAIPALIAYNYLKNSFKYLNSEMEDFLYKLLSTVELQYRKPL
jgi:biopolymer transport protein TolQ